MTEAKHEDRRLIDIELALLTLLLYVLVFVFAAYPVPTLAFFILFYLIEVRIFAAYHDRMHANNTGDNRILDRFVDHFCLFVTPWAEPYSSFKWKHFQHHKTHALPSHEPATHEDCHRVYQEGLAKSLLACLFYEEVQFFMDLRGKRINRERVVLILLYSCGILLFIHLFGLQKFAIVFLALRISGCTSWFSFSYGLHRESNYNAEFHKRVPVWLQRLATLLLGRRAVNNTLHHVLHHRYPSVRSRDLHRHYKLRAGQAELE